MPDAETPNDTRSKLVSPRAPRRHRRKRAAADVGASEGSPSAYRALDVDGGAESADGLAPLMQRPSATALQLRPSFGPASSEKRP